MLIVRLLAPRRVATYFVFQLSGVFVVVVVLLGACHVTTYEYVAGTRNGRLLCYPFSTWDTPRNLKSWNLNPEREPHLEYSYVGIEVAFFFMSQYFCQAEHLNWGTAQYDMPYRWNTLWNCPV